MSWRRTWICDAKFWTAGLLVNFLYNYTHYQQIHSFLFLKPLDHLPQKREDHTPGDLVHSWNIYIMLLLLGVVQFPDLPLVKSMAHFSIVFFDQAR